MIRIGGSANDDSDAMFEGKLVRLRALRSEDAEHHPQWRNDPEAVRWATAEAIGLGFETMLRLNPKESAVFTVEDLVGGSVIGMADYRDLDPYVGVATLGVTIGERESGPWPGVTRCGCSWTACSARMA